MTSANRSHTAFIFDLDGVLVHSMPLHVTAWEQYLQKHNLPIEDVEIRMHGKRNAELVRDFFGESLSAEEIFQHGADKEQLFRDLMSSHIEKYRIPGLRDFLERYRGVPKAIGSNAEPANIEFVLDAFDLREFFPVIVDGFQVARGKPAPDIYLRAAELLGRKPKDCIVFEDSNTGAAAGIAAGMRVVAVETTPTNFENVDLVVKDFTDPALGHWIQERVAA